MGDRGKTPFGSCHFHQKGIRLGESARRLLSLRANTTLHYLYYPRAAEPPGSVWQGTRTNHAGEAPRPSRTTGGRYIV